jgi:hypothetical protein
MSRRRSRQGEVSSDPPRAPRNVSYAGDERGIMCHINPADIFKKNRVRYYYRHMFGAWTNFSIVIFVQLLLFVIHAYYVERLSDVPRILGRSILVGIAFGLFCDLVGAEIFGISSYKLGFGPFFLTLNGALAYGIFAANTLLLQQARLPYFYIWTIFVMAVYEIANYFFPVWRWEFAMPPAQFLVVLSVGYFWGAINIAAVWHVFFGDGFVVISNLIKQTSSCIHQF